jgi:lipopolysaccharide export system protein LptC
VIRPTSWLPLAALTLLVALTLWLNQLVQPQGSRADGSTRHDPDLMVDNFNARALDLEGRVQYTLAARKMVHYPDDDSAHLEAVAIEAFEPRQPKLTLTADRGRLEEGGDRVTIEGNVVIVRESDARTEAMRITTEKLLVLPDAGKASTNSEVTMESPSSHAVAAGLELDNRERTLKLDQVRATFKPQPK